MSYYDIYEKPTEKFALNAEKAWYWALQLVYFGLMPIAIFLVIASLLYPSIWSNLWYLALLLLLALGIGHIFNFSIILEALLAMSYGVTSILKREPKWSLASASIIIALVTLSGPIIVVSLLFNSLL